MLTHLQNLLQTRPRLLLLPFRKESAAVTRVTCAIHACTRTSSGSADMDGHVGVHQSAAGARQGSKCYPQLCKIRSPAGTTGLLHMVDVLEIISRFADILDGAQSSLYLSLISLDNGMSDRSRCSGKEQPEIARVGCKGTWQVSHTRIEAESYAYVKQSAKAISCSAVWQLTRLAGSREIGE